MNRIHVLDEKTAGQIAAGEVIERPAGVLKELLENAIDAGARHIRVDIEGGGRELIRINDDGCGMTPDDLAASVLRHATSKITRFEDLNQLRTFGFRGEALYSVAAVSKMTLTSCTEGGEGSRLEVHGGKVLAQSPAPAIRGTTVEIRDLFYNVPARLKFLKSASYERACLLKVAEESALANLAVGYIVVSSGREVYRLPAQEGDEKDAVLARAKEILGPEAGGALVSRFFEELGLKIFITPPDKLVATRDLQFIFVNRRPVDSKTVQQAVYKAYQNVRPKDRHPAFIIYMDLDPASFDVNIHPQKRDIRFADEHAMFGAVMKAVSDTVFGSATPVQMQVSAPVQDQASVHAQPAPAETVISAPLPQITPAPAASAGLFEPVPGEAVSLPRTPQTDFAPKTDFSVRETEEPVEYRAASAPAGAPQPQTPAPEPAPETDAPAWWHGPYHYLGQLEKTYLVFENPDGLILPWLKEAGFDLTRFSPRTVLVNTVPSMLRFKEDDMKAFVTSLSQIVGDPDKSSDALKRKMVALLACKRAIKAHDQISAAEAEGLLENMKKCKDGMHCPHGRPCVAVLSTKDIAKLFGR